MIDNFDCCLSDTIQNGWGLIISLFTSPKQIGMIVALFLKSQTLLLKHDCNNKDLDLTRL